MKFPALITALSLCQAAPAETVSSLELPAIDREIAVSHNQWLASSFTAGPDAQTMRVEEISIRVSCLWPNANPFIAITGSEGGKPDLSDVRVVTDATALNDPVHLNAPFTLTLQPDESGGPAELLPDQDYWLVFGFTAPDYYSDLPSGLFFWSYAATGPGMQDADWSLGSLTATGGTAGQNWSTEASTPYSFGITLTPVPEPGSAALLLAGACILLRRRAR